VNRRYVALLRGINVGKAKRVSMADLRALVEGLGCRNVRTLLGSGNVVFDAPAGRAADLGARIEGALVERCGFSARTIVLGADELDEILAGNPLLDRVTDPARLLAGILADPADGGRLEPLLKRDWGEEALALGRRVVYSWCPGGQIGSPVAEAVARALGDRVTARNWATLTKLGALAAA